MVVFGKPLAEAILGNIKEDIQTNNLHPQLAIILAGNDPASRMYIKFKQVAAEKIGIKVTLYQFAESSFDECKKTLLALNKDPQTHGIIVQIPVYPSWNADELVHAVSPRKDVDGFIPESNFSPATAVGTWEMLAEFARLENFATIEEFLTHKNIVILGKGRTAGRPIRELLQEKGFHSELIDSKTENPNAILLQADIIISATGKKHIINGSNIKEGVYIVGVGVGKEVIEGEERAFGDINEEEIRQKAKLYCPTIGGIGPLTIACLLRNVVQAALNN